MVTDEAKLWHKVIKKALENVQAKSPAADDEVRKLCEAVQESILSNRFGQNLLFY
jgi:hypothetical protein